MKLSKLQQEFVRHYIPPGRAMFNATEAAKLAGYKWPNKIGYRVARSPKIAPLVEAYFTRRYGESTR